MITDSPRRVTIEVTPVKDLREVVANTNDSVRVRSGEHYFRMNKIRCNDITYMVQYWLAKQEPDGPRGYSIDELKKDGTTVWDNVHNNLALKHMKQMKKGDSILYYHTGKERQIVGIMSIISNPYSNPEETNSRFIVVDVKYKQKFKNPVTLNEIKNIGGEFTKWELLRISRLSVMPVSENIWNKILKLAK